MNKKNTEYQAIEIARLTFDWINVSVLPTHLSWIHSKNYVCCDGKQNELLS